MLLKALKYGVGLVLVGFAGLVVFLFVSPPALLKVGTNYSAKIVCSNVFIANRDAQEVLTVDVQAPGHPLLKHISVDVDAEAQRVEARVFRFFAPAVSQYRSGLGCTNVHDADLSSAKLESLPDAGPGVWPVGNDVTPIDNAALSDALSDPDLLGEGARAVVVVKNGRVVGEAYAEGFDETTPLLGWSMTKTVTASIIGALVQNGDMTVEDTLENTYPEWAQDGRNAVQVGDMLAMASGLDWNEDYGNVSDVTQMLYLNDDMAGFAANRDLASEVGTAFNYSSGTSTMLSRVWQDHLDDDGLSYPQEALFGPLGMTSAIMETDALDTYVGSSYMYATARDWARFGQFLLQKGVWNGQQILPVGYVDWMFEPVAVSEDVYGKGHLWIDSTENQGQFEGSVWLLGHDGQSVGVFPKRDIVIVRLGLTPSKIGYSQLPLAEAVLKALD
ncbi:CubicO group peptidase (beta-lactamase class C family) [Shimia isoporae]|uniref:CubicO group peptidase (Beta-lactamase class C family) n=1 Tax=Shimia isoporae TaxID=647720 RepID=A0A4R1NLY0_9RHOB|nr:serine hydrolase [Shimia isoporae]TCL08721.1 CubicO group peptidase (beta-lactamase class C family) [Shimia isoporae]